MFLYILWVVVFVLVFVLDTKLLGWVWGILCCIWFEKWFEKWFYEIGYKMFENILLPGLRILYWICWKNLSVNPPRRGGTPPSGELFCVKREMSRITVYGWVWEILCCICFMKLDTKLWGWVWGLIYCLVWEMVLWNWIQNCGGGFED